MRSRAISGSSRVMRDGKFFDLSMEVLPQFAMPGASCVWRHEIFRTERKPFSVIYSRYQRCVAPCGGVLECCYVMMQTRPLVRETWV